MEICVCFRAVHSVCMWDEKEGPPKIYEALQWDILEFIKQAQSVSKDIYVRERKNIYVHAFCLYFDFLTQINHHTFYKCNLCNFSCHIFACHQRFLFPIQILLKWHYEYLL